jgi:hypothetical protein
VCGRLTQYQKRRFVIVFVEPGERQRLQH